jgi:putative transposase
MDAHYKNDSSRLTLRPDCFYHIFNQGNNGQKIFYKEENFYFFLKKFAYYLTNYLDLYAYCLMTNHFHMLIKLKSTEQIIFSAKQDFEKFPKDLPDLKNLADLDLGKFVSKRFNYFFLSYSKSINKQENLSGNLFHKPFRRKFINNSRYLRYVITYIFIITQFIMNL